MSYTILNVDIKTNEIILIEDNFKKRERKKKRRGPVETKYPNLIESYD